MDWAAAPLEELAGAASASQAELEALLARPEEREAMWTLVERFAADWSSPEALAAVGAALETRAEQEAERVAVVAHALAARSPITDAAFGRRVRTALFRCMEEGPPRARRDAAGALAKLCYAAVERKELDIFVSTFVRSLVLPVRRLLEACSDDLQTAVYGAMIVAARGGAQSRDQPNVRDPDEVALFVVGGVYDAMAPFIANSITYTPMMNAVQGLCVSVYALGLVAMDGALMGVLRPKHGQSQLAARVVDAVELIAFKRVVAERSKESGDAGKRMGEAMLGVVGMSEGPAAMGFVFTNKQLEKEMKVITSQSKSLSLSLSLSHDRHRSAHSKTVSSSPCARKWSKKARPSASIASRRPCCASTLVPGSCAAFPAARRPIHRSPSAAHAAKPCCTAARSTRRVTGASTRQSAYQ